MTARAQLIAYLATLAALVVVYIASIMAAAINPAVMERVGDLGLAVITGGLIGVLRMPSQRGPEPTGTPADPVSVEEVR